MGTIKDRNCKDLTEAKEINKGGKTTQKNYIKKGPNDQDNHDGVTTYLEPDILECKVKWALRSITTNKASVGGGILAELYKILKDDAVYYTQWKKEKFVVCPTLCDPIDIQWHEIFQVRILEWVALPFSRGSSQPRDQTQVSCIAGRFFISRTTREAEEYWNG